MSSNKCVEKIMNIISLDTYYHNFKQIYIKKSQVETKHWKTVDMKYITITSTITLQESERKI